MTWIKLNGENKPQCSLPWSVGEPGIGATHLQKRHAGSVWECSCGIQHTWSGSDWSNKTCAKAVVA